MKRKGKFLLGARDEFSEYLQDNTFTRVVELIQNHHTYIPAYKHFKGDNHFALLESMERSHLERGFNQIAQNLTTFPDGLIAVCRPFDVIPAGIKGANSKGICIEHVGYFDIGGDQMSAEHKTTIVFANASLCARYVLTPSESSIVYHHWYDLVTGKRTDGTGSTKSCPGTNFFGGNGITAAKQNFIPLIETELAKITHFKAGATTDPQLPQGLVTATSLVVRTGPATSYKKVTSLKKGTIVAIYQEKKGWVKIHPDKQWVSGKYIEKI